MDTSIAREHKVCSASFDSLCKLGDTLAKTGPGIGPGTGLSSISDLYGRFNVWSGNIGAHQTGRVSLDHRLRKVNYVKDQVVRLLQYLHESLEDGNPNSSSFCFHSD